MAATDGVRTYFRATREPRYAILFALPLWLGYEGLAALEAGRTEIRNGADVVLKTGFVALGGANGLLAFTVLLVGIGLWLVIRDVKKSGAPRPRYFLAMFAEALVLAVLFGIVISTATVHLLGAMHVLAAPMPGGVRGTTAVMLALGAGLYEELLFRVLLVSGFTALGKRAFGWGPRGAGAFALVGSALVFSTFHYIGPYGDQFTLQSFTYRALGGLAFSALYVFRGFGIDAWTHALYDLMVMFL